MQVISCLIMLGFVSCTSNVRSHKSYVITEPRLTELHSMYVADVKAHELTLPDTRLIDMAFITPTANSELEGGKFLGVCVQYDTGARRVVITTDYMPYGQFRHLMYHELSHCYFDAVHSKNPLSLMHEIIATSPRTLKLITWRKQVDALFEYIRKGLP